MKKTKFTKKEVSLFKDMINTKMKRNKKELETINNLIKDQKKYIKNSEMSFGSDASKIRNREMLKRMRSRMVKKNEKYEAALGRIKAGTYGRDVRTGKMISTERLLAKPQATRDIMKMK